MSATSSLPTVRDKLYLDIAEKTSRVVLNVENILDVVVTVMEAAEKLTGADKKAWVMAVVTKLVKDNDLIDSKTKEDLTLFVSTQLDSIIELIIKGTKGAYAINKTVKSCFAFCK